MNNIYTTGHYVFRVFGIAQLIAVIWLIIWAIVKAIKFIKKNSLLKNRKQLVLSVICIIIATASLVFNIGWIRVFMTITLIPIIQPILFLVTNLYASKYFIEVPKLKIINFLFIITYLIFWILLPDGGDTGPLYCLFNLVHNDNFADVASSLSTLAGAAHIVFFVLQIIQFKKLKNKSESK